MAKGEGKGGEGDSLGDFWPLPPPPPLLWPPWGVVFIVASSRFQPTLGRSRCDKRAASERDNRTGQRRVEGGT